LIEINTQARLGAESPVHGSKSVQVHELDVGQAHGTQLQVTLA